MICMQIRKATGKAPYFSLDPPVRQDDKTPMQVKTWEPSWLAGTSAGEVMFQADYYLKELSMGEYDQPISGMKSCFDMAMEESPDSKWTGREWFMIRKAEIQLSDDNVLVPYVKMGVEAREQVKIENTVHDARINRSDHPLVKYAESFTRNFDLIAERKSVIYHLRELAKASVLAKFLVESEVDLPKSWLNLAKEDMGANASEIPMLWSERIFQKIDASGGTAKGGYIGLYGGVDLVYGPAAPRVGVVQEAGAPALAAPEAGAVAPTPGAPARITGDHPGHGGPPPRQRLQEPSCWRPCPEGRNARGRPGAPGRRSQLGRVRLDGGRPCGGQLRGARWSGCAHRCRFLFQHR